jgi:hypothetical protein
MCRVPAAWPHLRLPLRTRRCALLGRSAVRPNRRVGAPNTGVDWSRVLSRVVRISLPAFFLLHSSTMALYFVVRGLVGVDARIYSAAARTWLAGGNPWTTAVDGYYFAAPPPTLVPFIPFAFLGEWLSSVIWVVGSAVVALAIVRRPGLAWWWVLFPPVVNGVLAGNPDILIVGLILTGSTSLGTAATFMKFYAIAPLLGEGRWRAAIVAVGGLVITLPLLPWGLYLAQITAVMRTLDEQAIGISAYGTPWLMAGTGMALVALGPRLAGWLAVPAIWPSTQLHYSALALPALAQMRNHPLALLAATVLLSSEIVWFPAIAVVILATSVTWSRIASKRHGTGDIAVRRSADEPSFGLAKRALRRLAGEYQQALVPIPVEVAAEHGAMAMRSSPAGHTARADSGHEVART